MHWPEPVKHHFVGRGKFLGTIVALTAAVFGVIVAGPAGIGILALVIVVGLTVELWIEDARKTTLLSGQDSRFEALEREAQETRAAIEESSRKTCAALEAEIAELGSLLTLANDGLIDAAMLRAELAEAQDEADELRDQLRNPVFGFEQLIEVLAAQLTVIDLVQKHRVLAGDGLEDWPIVRVAVMDDGVVFEAFAGSDAERLVDEWVSIESGDEVLATVRVNSTTPREIFAVEALEALPIDLVEELERTTTMKPNGMRLRLAGLDFPPLSQLEDGALEDLRQSLADVAEGLRSALHSSGKQLQLRGGEELDAGPRDQDL